MAGLIPVQQCFLFLKTILVFNFLVEPFTVRDLSCFAQRNVYLNPFSISKSLIKMRAHPFNSENTGYYKITLNLFCFVNKIQNYFTQIFTRSTGNKAPIY
jgi:hypothetical protein